MIDGIEKVISGKWMWWLELGDAVDILKAMPGNTFDGIVNDPPYGINFYSNRAKTKAYRDRVNTVNGIPNDTEDGFILLAHGMLPELYRVLKDDSAMLWFTNWRMLGTSIDIIEKHGFKVKNAIVWDKVSKSMGDLKGSFGNAYEIILFAAKGRPLIKGSRVRDIYVHPRVSYAKRVHSHQKPLDLISYWMRKTMGNPDMLILDPCAGSGSTIVSSLRMGNRCIGIELDEETHSKGLERVKADVELGIYTQGSLPM